MKLILNYNLMLLFLFPFLYCHSGVAQDKVKVKKYNNVLINNKMKDGGEVRSTLLDDLKEKQRKLALKQIEKRRKEQRLIIKKILVSITETEKNDGLLHKLVKIEEILRRMITEKFETDLFALQKKIKKDILEVIPPKKYMVNMIEMHLIKVGEKEVYISKNAISVRTIKSFIKDLAEQKGKRVSPEKLNKLVLGKEENEAINIDYAFCENFCKWLGRKSNEYYRLPSIDEIKSSSDDINCACWTKTAWHNDRKVQVHYGVKLYTIYDPNNNLSSKNELGEVGFAKFAGLGFRIVAPLRSGIVNRYRKTHSLIIKQLKKEAEVKKELQDALLDDKPQIETRKDEEK